MVVTIKLQLTINGKFYATGPRRVKIHYSTRNLLNVESILVHSIFTHWRQYPASENLGWKFTLSLERSCPLIVNMKSVKFLI